MKCLELSLLILFLVCIHNAKSNSLNHFVSVANAFLDVPKERWGGIVHKEQCAEECLKRSNCLSFQFKLGKCFLSEYISSDDRKFETMLISYFYQLINPNQEYIAIKNAAIPHSKVPLEVEGLTFVECQERCRKNPDCYSFEAKLMCKNCQHVKCKFNFMESIIYPSNYEWSLYLSNPAYYTNRCPQTDPIKYVNMHIFDTTRFSEDLYKCLPGENQTASGEEAKLNSVSSDCSIPAMNHFVRIKNVSLNAPKERWGEIVDNYTCGNECLKRNNCHSFEMESGKCFLSEYIPSDDHRPMKNKKRDFYQRIDPNQEYIPVKYSSIFRKDDLGRKKDQTLDECQEHCRKIQNCHSFEAKLMCPSCKRYKCDLSTANHLTDNITPSIYDWDIYLLNPNYKLNCSEPVPMKNTKLNLFDSNLDSMANFKCLRSEIASETEFEKTSINATGKDVNLTTPAISCTDPLYYTCAKLQKCKRITFNWELPVAPRPLKGPKVLVYCDAMKTDTPKEYLTLKWPAYFEVPVISNTSSCLSVEMNRRRRYNKVRFLPEEMALDLSDHKFTTFEPIPPTKEKCVPKQNFTVDLRGTWVTISENARWVTSGISANITSVQKLEDDQLAVVSCSGKCGICKSANPFPVKLRIFS